MLDYRPTHLGIDLEEGWKTFLDINPHEIPSGLLSKKALGRIKKLSRKSMRGFRFFQDMVDAQYTRKNPVVNRI